MSSVFAIVGVVLVAAAVAAFLFTRRHPENAAGHLEAPRSGSAMMHGDADDRPAGPGAEDEYVSGDGRLGPGPSAENLPWPQDSADRTSEP